MAWLAANAVLAGRYAYVAARLMLPTAGRLEKLAQGAANALRLPAVGWCWALQRKRMTGILQASLPLAAGYGWSQANHPAGYPGRVAAGVSVKMW